jgi:hypothetical protein
MDSSVNHVCARSAMTPVTQTPPVLNVEDDKGKGVHEGQHVHGPADPGVPDVELLRRDGG